MKLIVSASNCRRAKDVSNGGDPRMFLMEMTQGCF
jgi:hypothetical protein